LKKFLDLLLLHPLWVRYDKVREPYRFLTCMALVLSPVWVLNGLIRVSHPAIYKGAAFFLLYLTTSATWKMSRIDHT
jgi:hypothetical protein